MLPDKPDELDTTEVAARLDGLAATCLLLFIQFSGELQRIITDRTVADALFSMQKQLEELARTIEDREFVPEGGK